MMTILTPTHNVTVYDAETAKQLKQKDLPGAHKSQM